MMTNKLNSIVVLAALVLVSMACNFSVSTANLSDLKFGKDKDASSPSTTFKPEDEIYAVTSINNAGGKNKIKFRLLFDDVEDREAGALAHKLEREMEVEGSRDVWFAFSVPGGFSPGRYKTEAVLSGEDGKELDRKTATFTVSGGKTSRTTKSKTDRKKVSTEETAGVKENTDETASSDTY